MMTSIKLAANFLVITPLVIVRVILRSHLIFFCLNSLSLEKVVKEAKVERAAKPPPPKKHLSRVPPKQVFNSLLVVFIVF
jgi:hypothetical protein